MQNRQANGARKPLPDLVIGKAKNDSIRRAFRKLEGSLSKTQMNIASLRKTLEIYSLLAILFVCILSNGDAVAQKAASSGHPYASDKPLTEAVMFAPGVVSTFEHEDSPGFSRDGRTVYWEYGNPVLSTIVYSDFKNGKWKKPQIASFSGQYPDRDPFETVDGKRLYFCSRRPAPGDANREVRKDWDVWFVEKTASGAWGEPHRLPQPVNTEHNELYPTLTASGRLYVGSDRTNDWELYRTDATANGFGELTNLGENINSKAWDFNPSISPDERFLLFSSQRLNVGPGSVNIYVSYNRDGAWTKAQPLNEKVNKPGFQYHPTLSPDGKYLFFCGGRGLDAKELTQPMSYQQMLSGFHNYNNRAGNIYQIELLAAGIEP
jgi:hypothetical protein